MRLPVAAYRRLLTRYLHPLRRRVGVLAGVLLLGILCRLGWPLLAGRFVDRVTDDGPTPELRTLVWIALAFGVVGVADQVCTVVGTHLGAHIGWTATNQLRTDLVGHALRLDLEFHHDNGPGTMMERIDGDARELNRFFSDFALKVAMNLVVVVGVLVVMTLYDWRIGTVYTGFALVAVYVFDRVRGVAAPYWKANRDAATTLYNDVEERFGGLADLRANGANDHAHRRFVEALRGVYHRNRTALSVSVMIGSGSELVLVVGGTAILAAASVLSLHGVLSLGQVVSLALLTRIVSRPLQEIARELGDLQRATASIARVGELLSTEPAIVSGPGAALPPGPLAVAFENVSFAYAGRPGGTTAPGTDPPDPPDPPDPTDPPATLGTPGPQGSRRALTEVSFELSAGEVLGVVGRSGSGKSTLARLLLRFYDPDRGRITLAGTDLRTARLEELRRSIGVVTQEVQLFHATVRDNLTLFAADGARDETLEELLREVGLGPWYQRQNDGLDTLLPPGGGGMSAGEAQLLAIARVFLTDPGVVVLDEPTSRLDPATEAELERAVDRLLAGRTGVIIAHRLATLRRADRILVMDGGVVVEYGSRTALEVAPESAYHRALALARGEPDSPAVVPDSSSVVPDSPPVVPDGGSSC